MAAPQRRHGRPAVRRRVVELEVAGLAAAVDVIAQRRPALRDGVGERRAQLVHEARPAAASTRGSPGCVGRIPARNRRFVGVDIANAYDEMIVHQRQLDRRASGAASRARGSRRCRPGRTAPARARTSSGCASAGAGARASRRNGAGRDSAASRRNRERCRHGRAAPRRRARRTPAGCRSSRSERAACRVDSRKSRYLLRRSRASTVRPAMRVGSQRGTDQRRRWSYMCMAATRRPTDERAQCLRSVVSTSGQFRHGASRWNRTAERPPEAATPVWWTAEYTS